MAQVTADDVRLALDAWEKAREKVALQRDRLGAFLSDQRETITKWQIWAATPTDGLNYQQAKTKPGNQTTPDLIALEEAVKEMHDCRDTYLKLASALPK